MNTISVAGKLRGTPQIKQFEDTFILSGVVTDFGSASYMKDGERKVGAIFHNFEVRGSQKKIDFFKDMYGEGRPVTLIGALSQRPYTKDGEDKIWQTVTVDRFAFHLEEGEGGAKAPTSKTSSSSSTPSRSPVDDNDLFGD